MAGVMALINQKTGSIQGNPNAEFYKLAAKQTYSNCSAETVTNSSSCYFNDIDAGNISIGSTLIPNNIDVPCAMPGYGNCSDLHKFDFIGVLGYNADTGYDLATGLGSLNVANVVNSFVGIGNHPALVTVSPAQSSITTNQSLSVTVTVTSAYTGGGTPTGTVNLNGGGYSSSVETLNASGVYTFNIPGDSLNPGSGIVLLANYSGDATYAQESNTATVSVSQLTPGMVVSAPSTLNSNYPLTVTVTVSATGTGATPTGTVTLNTVGLTTAVRFTSAVTPLDANGVATIIIPGNTLQNTQSVSLDVSYSGDLTYQPDTGAALVAVTYVPVLPSNILFTPASISINSGAALNETVTVWGTSTDEASPTGTVTLVVTVGDTGTVVYTSPAEPLVGGIYTFTIPANTFETYGNGYYTLTVTYSGDPFYSWDLFVDEESVSVTESSFTLTAPATEPTISSPGGSATAVITVATTTGYTGTVTFSSTSCQLTGGPANSSTDAPACTAPSGSMSMGGTANFTVNTTPASSAALVYPKLPGKGWAGAGGGAVLALLLFLGVPARRRSWRSMLGILLLMATLGSFSACGGGGSAGSGGGGGGGGGGGSSDPGTAAGTYTFTVTGTGNPSVSPTPSVSFSVLVN
jgi:hypothetical protein